MNPKNLQDQTKKFALRIIKLAEHLKKHLIGKFIGRQIFRSGTSIAANYRAACRAKSAKDFISKLGIVIEEADETSFWIELLNESGMIQKTLVLELLKESNEITAIMVASRNSTIKNQRQK
ncbi:MAG: four helix bundle protein [Candidatus Doudnabacteria bacterium]|nr:four helix bundle protein [Candidatus Doudnabacteria bacterium]